MRDPDGSVLTADADGSVCAGRAADDSNLEKFEEAGGPGEDEGQKLEPFNMAAEREEGYFDEEGHHVERTVEDGADKDAWLTSGEGDWPGYLQIL